MTSLLAVGQASARGLGASDWSRLDRHGLGVLEVSSLACSAFGGRLVFGGACSHFAAGIDGFAFSGTRVAGVSRLGEDEGELERTTYCTVVWEWLLAV